MINQIKIHCYDPNYKDSRLTFNKIYNQRDNAKIFTYIHPLYEWHWIDNNVYKEQFKEFRKNIKNGKIECNTKKKFKIIRGVKWYYLIINHIKDGYDLLDIGSMEIFSLYIEGYVCYFKSENDRDNMMLYHNKK